MIPKIIHYCWFGGKPLPKLARKCKDSWERVFPDYEIKEWNESSFDVNAHPYTKYCYEHRLWAYLSDFVRLCVVEREGGLYFDTDVEAVRYPEEILQSCTAFFGWETNEYVNTGLGFGAEQHHPVVQAMLNEYGGLVVDAAYQYDSMQGCPQLNTKALMLFGLVLDGNDQMLEGIRVLPVEYLCPFHDATGRLNKTERTISIHWFSKAPHGKWAAWKMIFTRPLHRLLGQ